VVVQFQQCSYEWFHGKHCMNHQMFTAALCACHCTLDHSRRTLLFVTLGFDAGGLARWAKSNPRHLCTKMAAACCQSVLHRCSQPRFSMKLQHAVRNCSDDSCGCSVSLVILRDMLLLTTSEMCSRNTRAPKTACLCFAHSVIHRIH
jgi:hypothetical protein